MKHNHRSPKNLIESRPASCNHVGDLEYMWPSELELLGHVSTTPRPLSRILEGLPAWKTTYYNAMARLIARGLVESYQEGPRKKPTTAYYYKLSEKGLETRLFHDGLSSKAVCIA